MAEIDKKNEIQIEEVNLGAAQKRDPNAPLEDIELPEEFFDARQEAIGEIRRYVGPTYDKEDEEFESLSDSEEDSDLPVVPPTDCLEPEESNE